VRAAPPPSRRPRGAAPRAPRRSARSGTRRGRWGPRRRSSRRAPRVEVRAVGLVQAVGQPAAHEVPVALGEPEHEQRGVGDVGDGVGHRHLGGQRGPRVLGAHRLVGHDEDRLQADRRLQPRRHPVGADDEAAPQRGRDVVGMALELGGQRQDVGVELEQVVGSHQARDVGRRARPQPAGERDLRADAELERVGRVEALEAAHDEVAPVAGDRQVGDDGEAAGLDDLDLGVQRQGRGEAVEPRAEVGRRGGDADEAAALHGARP
jgi:hypothetical protein